MYLFSFKQGLYLAQAIQIAFFIALLVQVASSVRHKIWMKESGNSMVSEMEFILILINFGELSNKSIILSIIKQPKDSVVKIEQLFKILTF